jgi:hypothetical protein
MMILAQQVKRETPLQDCASTLRLFVAKATL